MVKKHLIAVGKGFLAELDEVFKLRGNPWRVIHMEFDLFEWHNVVKAADADKGYKQLQFVLATVRGVQNTPIDRG